MTTADKLVAARALIADPANWIKGANFREIEGRECYCARGALREASDCDYRALMALRAHLDHSPPSISAFNDDPATTHADVMALFDRAIEAERADYREEWRP